MSAGLFRSHPRLIFAAGAGLLGGCCLMTPPSMAITRVLVGWNIAVWTYLSLIAWHTLRPPRGKARATAAQENRSSFVILILLSTGAALSLAAIVLELNQAKDMHGWMRTLHYLLTGATVTGSWLLVCVIYALHYAHLYFESPRGARPLQFPDKELLPEYIDFLYFSFNIGAAAQTSDVRIQSSKMRRVVLAHCLISFLFNAAIIGMSINVAAGIISG